MNRYILIVWFTGFLFFNGISQENQIESLKTKLQTASPKDKVSLYLKIADQSETYDDRVSYCERAINIANELKDIELQANSNFTLGIYHYSEGKYTDSERCFQESLGYYNKRNDTKSVAKNYYWLALSYRYWGKFQIAVKYAQMCLDLNERIKSPEGIIDANLVSGNIYQAWGDQKKADACFSKVLKDLDKKGNKTTLGTALVGKGNVLFAKGKIDSAKIFYDKAFDVFEALNSKFGLASSLKELAKYYIFKKDYKKAELSIDRTLAIYKDIKNKRGTYEALILKGDLYFKKANSARAVELYLAGQKLANEMGISDEIAENYRTISKLYETKKDQAKALKYYKLYANIKDSSSASISSEELLNIQSISDSEKKEKEMLAIKAEKKFNKADSDRKTTLISAVLIGILLLGGLAFILLKGHKKEIVDSKTINDQKQVIESLENKIGASEDYAERIQSAMLVDTKNMGISNFVIFKPCEKVSGDFYWYKKIENQIIIAVADCTGHGVPGAFMSTMGISILNAIIGTKKQFDCAEILEEMRSTVKSSLKQDIFDEKSKDLIELALCIIDTETLEMKFAGANMPLYIISKGGLEILKGTNNPLGAYLKEKPFENYQAKLNKGDNIYMFSNGYMDQFGGKEGKKFKITHFRDALLAICWSDMDTQKELLENIFEEWKSDRFDQTDDVLVLGLKI